MDMTLLRGSPVALQSIAVWREGSGSAASTEVISEDTSNSSELTTGAILGKPLMPLACPHPGQALQAPLRIWDVTLPFFSLCSPPRLHTSA